MKHFLVTCFVLAISYTQAQTPRKAILSIDAINSFDDPDKSGFYALIYKRNTQTGEFGQQPAEFEVRKVNLPEYYREDKTTNYEKLQRDSIQFFFRGFSFPRQRINGVLLKGKQLFPGESILVLDHHIYATGNVVRSTDTTSLEVFTEIKNYSLGIRSKRGNTIIDQRMVSMDLRRWLTADYLGGFFLLWAGDLDADNELDILLYSTAHHECTSLMLLSFTKKGKVYIKHREEICAD